jgi:CHAT domain-containing protein/tetratricopeptide (TPR) repeat protein
MSVWINILAFTHKSTSAKIDLSFFFLAFLTLILALDQNTFAERLEAETTDCYFNQTGNAAPSPLQKTQTLHRQINGGDTQFFAFDLPAGQSAELTFQWEGMDLDVRVITPNRSNLFPSSIPVRGFGPIPILVLAEESGTFQVEVRTVEQIKIAGSFSVTLKDFRHPNSTDSSRFAALLLMAEGQSQRSRPQAIEKYQKALELWRAANDNLGECYALQRLGNAFISSKDTNNADKHFNSLIKLRESLNDPRSLIYTLREIGQDYRAFASPTKAIELYQTALQLARQIKDRRAEAAVLYSLGIAYQNMGHPAEALKFYEPARVIQHEDNDRLSETRTMNAMGGAYNGLGDQTTSLKFFEQVLAFYDELKDTYRTAITKNNIGLAYDDLGNFQKAKDNYLDAIAKYRSLLNNDAAACKQGASTQSLTYCNSLATTTDNIGELYNTLGDPQMAIETFQQSLAIRRIQERPREVGLTLSRLGYSHAMQGLPEKAIEFCDEALKFNRVAEDARGTASTLTILGMAHAALNRNVKALEYYEEALKLQRDSREKRGEGISLNKIGALYLSEGNHKGALDSYNKALQLWREVKDEDGEAITLYQIASLHRDRGNLSEASLQAQAALTIVESRRATIHSKRLLDSYFAGKQDYYELLIDVEMGLAKSDQTGASVGRALEASERARSRRLLDALVESGFVKSTDNTSLASTSQLKELSQRQRVLATNLSAKGNARTLLLSGKHTKEQELAFDKEIERISAEFDEIESRIRLLDPAYAALARPQPLTVQQIQAELDPDTVFLEYSLGEKRSYLWAVTRDSVSGFELAGRKEIEQLASTLINSITSFGPIGTETSLQRRTRRERVELEHIKTSAALSDRLLKPVARLLGTKRIAIVADGALQLVPFGALPSPNISSSSTKSLLVETNELISLPSASVLAVQRKRLEHRKSASQMVAVFADPVFDSFDNRVRQARRASPQQNKNSSPLAVDNSADSESLTRALGESGRDNLMPLFFSRLEAQSIINVVPKGQARAVLGFDANRSNVMSPELSKYRVIHFATHGILNLDHPELSGLVLSMVDKKGDSQNGFLQMHEIYRLKLPADLVVLSGCETGIGKQVKGEGLIALTRGFMYAGAARVVASLWRVDDAATAELMGQFYREMYINKKNPAEALRAAQIYMSVRKPWTSPYYWAGFVLYGEWR